MMDALIPKRLVLISAFLLLPVIAFSQASSIPLDREILKILDERDKGKSKKLEEQVREVPALDMCQEMNGKLFFVTPLFNFVVEEMSTAGKRFFNVEALDFAIQEKMRREGITPRELCEDLKDKMEKVKYDSKYDYWQFMDDLVECKSACGKVLSAMGAVYIHTSARYFKGLIRFDYNSANLKYRFKGDSRSHSRVVVDNISQLENVYRLWDKDRSQKIGLDARASLPGPRDYNNDLSRQRLNAVINWFTKARDVPESMIDRKWLGSYGPHIDEIIADMYGISGMFRDYKRRNSKKTPTRAGDGTIYIYDGINQSVSVFLYKPEDRVN